MEFDFDTETGLFNGKHDQKAAYKMVSDAFKNLDIQDVEHQIKKFGWTQETATLWVVGVVYAVLKANYLVKPRYLKRAIAMNESFLATPYRGWKGGDTKRNHQLELEINLFKKHL